MFLELAQMGDFLHSVGMFIRAVTEGAIAPDVALSMWAEILSGPVTLLVSKVESEQNTSCLPIHYVP